MTETREQLSHRLGAVTTGSFSAGLTVRLDPDISIEQMNIGGFCIVEGKKNRYFSIISDMQLRAQGKQVYATVQVKPMLMLSKANNGVPRAVKTIPMHASILNEAGEEDFRVVFGNEKENRYFPMGTPLTMDIPICINLERLAERSNGIFGQSGTGKSFLVRLLLCGIIKNEIAVNLIFDMHDEYAFGKESEDGVFVKGLSHLFGHSRVLVYSLDKKAATRGGGRGVDTVIQIGLNQIEVDDILLLSKELNLRGTADATMGLLEDWYKKEWLSRLITMTPGEIDLFCEESGAHPASVAALRRSLKRLQRKEYIVDQSNFNLIDEMVGVLDNGQNVIVHFGRHDSMLDHMLVANLITRRVRSLYRSKVERYERTQNQGDKPHPLMITIEEAHSFLSPAIARQTIFGTIARELRKYHVTLLVVDQRPSSIDDEVLSQLGTRISGKLTEERDIKAVLTGVANQAFLRGALEGLDTREQIILIGHAVPMPITIRTRKYNADFYQAMTSNDEGVPETGTEAIAALFDF